MFWKNHTKKLEKAIDLANAALQEATAIRKVQSAMIDRLEGQNQVLMDRLMAQNFQEFKTFTFQDMDSANVEDYNPLEDYENVGEEIDDAPAQES